MFREILAQYRRHGWRLAGVLARAETLAELRAEVDAMWFTRPSSEGREAWELRLVAGTPYALFELFEPDEDEEDRADVRREMEARLRDYAAPREESGGAA